MSYGSRFLQSHLYRTVLASFLGGLLQDYKFSECDLPGYAGFFVFVI